MIVRSLDRAKMSWSYEMDLQDLLSATDVEGMPFGSVFGSVPARSVSKRHSHHDGEMFVVLDGEATVVVDAEEQLLVRGDVVCLPPFSVHEIRNDSEAPFDLVSVYWEDIPAAVSVLRRSPARQRLPQRTLVFCPPPTPNGGLHLGHLAGPYVRADLYARALRSMGCDARLITGTDDHQSYVSVAARLTGSTGTEVARKEGDAVVATLADAGVHPTRLTRPVHEPDHHSSVRALLGRLSAAEGVATRSEPTAYCGACRTSLHQAFARGDCARCGAGSDGEICEACGFPNEARELHGVRCRLCGAAAEVRVEEALWLDLAHYQDRLRTYLGSTVGGPDLRALAESLLDDEAGLRPYRLTRSTDWGIDWPSGSAEAEGAVARVDAWVDLALTFLLAAQREREHEAEPFETALFLGYDNSYYYAILLPVLAIALGLEHLLPTSFVTNRFLQLDGEKFSTSRGHALWADEALTRVGPDAVRAALMRHAPEGAESSISKEEGARLGQDPLVEGAREWIDGFAPLVQRFGPEVPGTGAWTDAHREFYRSVNSLTGQLDGALVPGAFSARAYVRGLEGLLDRAQRFRATEGPLRATPSFQEEARTSLALEFLAAKAFAALAWPVLPETASRLWTALGLSGEPVREQEWSFLPPGHRVAAPSGFGSPVGGG
ncbi:MULTISPECIES: class I tRNA ligase family protein [Streptacidiphilus]|uniref:Class I tRNA ligase family protein n=1 Tax=Streptacidiphilus cavernicola TaxID=3342716 RepID=A0ABV6UX77_9ACTN|nr:class I tRNA ligase family protein [Streptacidiphilus jeojiense]